MASSPLQTPWTFGFSDIGRQEFNAMDKAIKIQIKKKIEKLLSGRTNPVSALKRLTGNLSPLHSLRVGQYRLICEVDGTRYTIIAVHVAHRKFVYE